MYKKPAFYCNHFFLLSEDKRIVGVECGGTQYMLGDRVRIGDDGQGYITPGITRKGYGTIIELTEYQTDHYFGVRMDNGEFGFVKYARIAEVLSAAS